MVYTEESNFVLILLNYQVDFKLEFQCNENSKIQCGLLWKYLSDSETKFIDSIWSNSFNHNQLPSPSIIGSSTELISQQIDFLSKISSAGVVTL